MYSTICGEAKQPNLSWAWLNSAQLVCGPSLCKPDICLWTWLPAIWWSEWLTMTMALVVWPVTFVCCVSDIISQIKGTRTVDSLVSGEIPWGWLPMVVVTYNTVGWAENDYQDTDRSLAVLLSMDSTTHGVPVRHSEEPAKGENRGSIKGRNHAKAVSIY